MALNKQKKKLGEVLLEYGFIDHFQLESALQYQQKWGGRLKLGAALVHLGFITEDKLVNALHRYYGTPVVKLSSLNIPKETLNLVPENVAKKFLVLPIGKKWEASNKILGLAMADPTDLVAINEIEFTTAHKVKPYIASITDIKRSIERNYHGVELTPAEPEPAQQQEETAVFTRGVESLLVEDAPAEAETVAPGNDFDRFIGSTSLGANLNEIVLDEGGRKLTVGPSPAERSTAELKQAPPEPPRSDLARDLFQLTKQLEALTGRLKEVEAQNREFARLMKIYNATFRALFRKGLLKKTDVEGEGG